MEIVYITFEKITGLKGTIRGTFRVDNLVNFKLPLIYERWIPESGFQFRQDNRIINITPVEPMAISNFHEHFQYGTNFLIKEWSNGRGDGIKINSQHPN